MFSFTKIAFLATTIMSIVSSNTLAIIGEACGVFKPCVTGYNLICEQSNLNSQTKRCVRGSPRELCRNQRDCSWRMSCTGAYCLLNNNQRCNANDECKSGRCQEVKGINRCLPKLGV